MPSVGDLEPAAVFQTLDRRSLSLGSLRGKIVVLTFTSFTCPPCRALEPKLAEFAAGHRDVVFINVSIDKPENLGKLAALRRGGDPTVLVQDVYNVDRSKMAVWMFGNVATPTMFVIDRNGRFASQGNQDGTDGLKRLEFRIEWAKKHS
jgi:thiol-disulfide isomerase/thioredoxin